jgi:AraC-like DNA-binding protein
MEQKAPCLQEEHLAPFVSCLKKRLLNNMLVPVMNKPFLDQLMLDLLEGRAEPKIHPQFLGYMWREDGWGSSCWKAHEEFTVFYFVEHGEIRASTSGCSVVIGPGEGLVIPARATPFIQWSRPIGLREFWLSTPRARESLSLYPFRMRSELPLLIDHLAHEVAQAHRFPSADRLRSRVALICSLCSESVAEFAHKQRRLTANQRIRIVRFTRENLSKPLSPVKLAKLVGLTPDYFSRLFRNSFDLPPREWILIERVRTARRMLDGGASLDTTMASCGFRDLSYFSRQLKRITGKTIQGGTGWYRKHRK